MYCLDCGYLLNGISGRNCPECGRSFSPHRSATYATCNLRWDKKVFDAVLPLIFLMAAALNLIGCIIASAVVLFALNDGNIYIAGCALLVAAGLGAVFRICARAC